MAKPHPDALAAQTSSQVVNRPLVAADVAALSALHAQVFGPGRYARTAYRVREGTPAISLLCRGAFKGEALIASLRLTPIAIGASRPHLLLGPLAVLPKFAGLGYGKSLVCEALAHAQSLGFASIVLIGEMAYYERFGFAPIRPGTVMFPGPVNPTRILGQALMPGGLDDAQGLVAAIPLRPKEI